MKSFVFALTIVGAVLFATNIANAAPQPVNAILGDASFIYVFGAYPDEQTDETLRLATHLAYVEELLRSRDVSNWPDELRRRRAEALDLLHDYWTSGRFPHNYDYVDTRRPCFVDKDGSICAVGYLVEQTAGRSTAEAINSAHKYEYVLEMNDPTVDEWIAQSGLTEVECAMIQPTYDYYRSCRENEISREYGALSGLLGGTSLSLSVVNGIQISKRNTNYLVPTLGIIAGGAQVILGAAYYPEDYCDNHAKENLSIANIGIGAASIGMSIWNLSMKNRKLESRSSWNFFSYPTTDKKETGLGLSLTRRL